MAGALTFGLGGTDFQAEPVKLDRKKVYGWTGAAAKAKKSRQEAR